ncbi:response regulator with CheY-like receiver domain and winged-helix DNA-binding domain [Sphaerochaeta pleomorpha str. Grapes]|uniref:Phosphate regulon transcriptional regulatory protein PhoB n=1 Tax=Sphaerochaeta pleomorpha (strain ATCC BAA-1885 / DSM 22778 / Grapes) TaxID=158190 RepID=G8QX51_SPHPG|nr:response regulator transcription factor [Sphaerochaeta pleomorpha]AEV30636.1 response regulator with CheY-like receiver domain and winged-helix DNA-binding domain [Sphaerochaeta pleomorpha str. Grapes]
MSSQVILVVEDEPAIREGIRILLGGEGYIVREAASGEEALHQMNDTIDLVILDVMLPGISGIKVCEEIRKTSTVPILFLTAKFQESDKTIGLTAGGDDYLSKPFSYAELIARVKALLRRYCVYREKKQTMALDKDQILTSGRLKIALDRNEVWKNGVPLDLTEIEYRILALLIQHPQRIFSTHTIYESVWNEPYFYSANSTIMVHIRKLRTKIEDDPQNPCYIRNVWGKGYRYETEKPCS